MGEQHRHNVLILVIVTTLPQLPPQFAKAALPSDQTSPLLAPPVTTAGGVKGWGGSALPPWWPWCGGLRMPAPRPPGVP